MNLAHWPRMKLPLRSSATACWISAWVFMTIGPYHATGSRIGLPETSRKRMPSSPAWTVTSSPRSNRTSERLPVRSRIRISLAVDLLLGQDAVRVRGVGEAAGAREHVGEGVALGLDLERLALAGRHRDVEVARVGGDAVDGAAPTPELAADDPHHRAVVVDDLGDLGARARPGSAGRSSSATTAGWPRAGSRASGPAGSPCGISWCRMPRPAVIHCTSPAPSEPWLPRLSAWSTVPAST